MLEGQIQSYATYSSEWHCPRGRKDVERTLQDGLTNGGINRTEHAFDLIFHVGGDAFLIFIIKCWKNYSGMSARNRMNPDLEQCVERTKEKACCTSNLGNWVHSHLTVQCSNLCGKGGDSEGRSNCDVTPVKLVQSMWHVTPPQNGWETCMAFLKVLDQRAVTVHYASCGSLCYIWWNYCSLL